MYFSWPLAFCILIHTHLSLLVDGQTTNAVCNNNSETGFTFNSAGESPCLVWSRLQSLCIPDSAFVNVPPLVDSTYGYNAPGSGGTACQCNIAAYNLMAACSWCQVGGDSTWSNQQVYGAGCTEFQETGLGFSQDSVDLPPFVWRNWGNDRFDPALAAAAAPSFATTSLTPESTILSRSFPPVSSPSTSSVSSGTTRSDSPQTSSLANSSAAVPSATDQPGSEHGKENQDSDTPWAIILGSIGGAVAAVVVVSMLVFFCFLRRKRRRTVDRVESPKPDTQPETGRRFDPSYHTSTDWKNKRKSFLDILANPNERKGGTGKRSTGMTELFNDPKSFFSPRTPPRPFALAQSQRQRKDSNDSIESLRYTTTSERLHSRERTGSFNSGSEVSFGVGPPKIVPTYVKAKRATNVSVVSPMTARTDMGSTHRGPGGLLEAVNVMKREDEGDPLETPSTIATRSDKGGSYPFPRVSTPPPNKALPRPPPLKSRLSTRIPDSRFSSTPVALPLPPVTPAQDFTLPPEEYRRKQSRQYSGSKVITRDPRGSSALPSLYEPQPDAPRFSVSQRTDYRKSVASPRKSAVMSDDGDSMIYSASTDSRYPSFIPDAETVSRVKGMFGLSNIQFPLPPTKVHRKSGNGVDEAMSPQEWNKAKSKAKLTQEVMNIGKKDPIVERGNENGIRKGGI